MLNKGNPQISFYSAEMYDHLIPRDHFLRRLQQVIDLSFVNKLVSRLYSKNIGRPSPDIGGMLMVKALPPIPLQYRR